MLPMLNWLSRENRRRKRMQENCFSGPAVVCFVFASTHYCQICCDTSRWGFALKIYFKHFGTYPLLATGAEGWSWLKTVKCWISECFGYVYGVFEIKKKKEKEIGIEYERPWTWRKDSSSGAFSLKYRSNVLRENYFPSAWLGRQKVHYRMHFLWAADEPLCSCILQSHFHSFKLWHLLCLEWGIPGTLKVGFRFPHHSGASDDLR